MPDSSLSVIHATLTPRFAHIDGDHLTLLNVYHAFKQNMEDPQVRLSLTLRWDLHGFLQQFVTLDFLTVVLRQLCQLQKLEISWQREATALQNHGQVKLHFLIFVRSVYLFPCHGMLHASLSSDSTWRERAQTSHPKTITWTSGKPFARAFSCRWLFSRASLTVIILRNEIEKGLRAV